MIAVLDVFTPISVAAGAFFFFAGTVGLLRFPDVYTRLHAVAKADTLGLGLIVLGLLPQAHSAGAGLKLAFIWLLAVLSAASVSQLITQNARRSEHS
jgi:multicomponent Na+:H+ antiporter subunit G